MHWSSLKKSLLLLAGAAFGSLLFIARSSIRGIRIDWDIDTFITIGQSFLKGNQIYIDFFDPKWPHVQWLFFPGAISQSLNIHLLASWFTLAGTGLAITLIACIRNRKRTTPQSDQTRTAGALYVLLAPLLPGGSIGHLEVYSNFFMATGACVIALGVESHEIKRNRIATFIGSTLIGISAGIRPNLLIPIALLTLFLFLARRSYSAGKVRFGAIAAGLATGVLLPFTPYLASIDTLNMAWHGAIGILREWNTAMYPNSTLESFASEVIQLLSPKTFGIPFIFLFAFLFGLILSGVSNRSRNRKILCLLLGAWLTGLYLSYWKSHIHHHYILMDLCGACIFLAFVERALKPASRKLALWATLLILAGVSFYPMRPASAGDRQVLETQDKLLEYLASDTSITFAAPEFINLHWRRNQPVSTQGIHPVWSINMIDSSINQSQPAKQLGLHTTIEGQCDRWLSREVDLFIASPHLSQRCLAALEANWEEISKVALPSQDQSVQIFAKRGHSLN
ncbi:hypothetical protein [Synechococcus sp. W4D4]|uniref:hypothetical protein n=1 Tax=Synechococcus sp. W4D4 TaxID=3392294 RepID=UPI0039E99524